MNIFSIITYTSSMIFLFLGVYIYRLEKRSELNQTFLYLCLSMSLWAFTYTFVYPARTQEIAFAWMNISSIGVLTLPTFLFHFVVIFTERKIPFKRVIYFIIIFLPALFLEIVLVITGKLTVDHLVATPYGWSEVVADKSIWFWLTNAEYIIFLILCIVLIIEYLLRVRNKKKRIQSIIILSSCIVTFVFSYGFDIIIPLLKINHFPAIAPVFFLIWAGGISYSISRFRLMNLTPEVAMGDILSKIKELLFLLNPSGDIILANSNSYKILGYEEDSLIDIPFRSLMIYDFASMENDPTHNNEYLPSKMSVELRPFDGSPIPVNISTSVVKDIHGDNLGVVVVGEDMRIEQRLNNLKEEKELSEMKTKFITTISHEIRTPLTTILLSIDTLDKYHEKMNQTKKQKYYKQIRLAIHRITELLDEAFLINKAKSGSIVQKPEMLNLHHLFEEMIENIQNSSGCSHKIKLHINSSSDTAYLDSKLMNYIFMNLLSNAIKYSPEKSSIDFSISSKNDGLVFQVSDNGIGILKNDLPQIFEFFLRGENVGNVSGTGLGLPLVKYCLDLINGEISVESKPNHGTTFSVYIPQPNKSEIQ